MLKKLYMQRKLVLFFTSLFCLPFAEPAACEFCFDEEPMLGAATPRGNPIQPSLPPCEEMYGKFTYVKLGGSVASVRSSEDIFPAIGIGKRFEWNGCGVDISFNFGGEECDYQYSIPKILYIHYILPTEESSPYIGGGMSWGKIRTWQEEFQGILGELAFGYEFQRFSPIRTFFELDLSHGLIGTRKKNGSPGLAMVLAGGIGY